MAYLYSNCNLQLEYKSCEDNNFSCFLLRPDVPFFQEVFQMPKCFLTGIEVPMENAYLLDCGAAKKALHNLKLRVAAVERIVAQLSPKDQTEVYDYKSKSTKVRPERRLVCQTVAAALSGSYPESPLFVAWPAFKARRPPVFPELRTTGNGAEQPQRAPDTPAIEVAPEAAHACS